MLRRTLVGGLQRAHFRRSYRSIWTGIISVIKRSSVPHWNQMLANTAVQFVCPVCPVRLSGVSARPVERASVSPCLTIPNRLSARVSLAKSDNLSSSSCRFFSLMFFDAFSFYSLSLKLNFLMSGAELPSVSEGFCKKKEKRRRNCISLYCIFAHKQYSTTSTTISTSLQFICVLTLYAGLCLINSSWTNYYHY